MKVLFGLDTIAKINLIYLQWNLDLTKELGKFVGYVEGSYLENLDLANFRGKIPETPRFSDSEQFLRISVINICSYTKLLSQYRAAHSYGTRSSRNKRRTKLFETAVQINFILVGLFRIHLS